MIPYDLTNDVSKDYDSEKSLSTRFLNFSTRPSGPQRVPFVISRGKVCKSSDPQPPVCGSNGAGPSKEH
ncbi:hypothetical protein TNCV_3587301 [Trichonephila clavipes]|nr:hypothetical protein TNCV_3587301 [Trichonephila clavipes]